MSRDLTDLQKAAAQHYLDVVHERDALRTTIAHLTAERDALKASNLELIQERDEALRKMNERPDEIALDIERQAIQAMHDILRRERDAAVARAEKAEAFKAYVHARLDAAGVPVDPESEHKAKGCRIGGRLDWLIGSIARADKAEKERDVAIAQRDGALGQNFVFSKDLEAAEARAEKAELAYDLLEQGSAGLCDTCGWNMKFPDEPCYFCTAEQAQQRVENCVYLEDRAQAEAKRLREALTVARGFAIRVREQAGHPLADIADNMVDAIIEALADEPTSPPSESTGEGT